MKLRKLYELAVKFGIEADPRGKEAVKESLLRQKKVYDELKEPDKKDFDLERLVSPFADTRILFGTNNIDVKTAMVGVDIEASEILLADRLRALGQKIDVVIGHHPEGYAYASFYEVMNMQADILAKFGVPINVAEGLLAERIAEVSRRVHPSNYNRPVDTAKLLDMPFMCMHTVADNHVAGFLQALFDDKKPKSLDEIVKILKSIPEYAQAAKEGAGPKILNGKPDSRPGKIFIDMTGGTEGSKEIFSKLANAGVGTIICMHLSEDHLNKVKPENINVVIAGHISSDNLGLNLLLDKLQKEEKFEVIECSGFKRVKR